MLATDSCGIKKVVSDGGHNGTAGGVTIRFGVIVETHDRRSKQIYNYEVTMI